jgi:hypothetical protein
MLTRDALQLQPRRAQMLMRKRNLLVLATLAWAALLGAHQQPAAAKPRAGCPHHRAHAVAPAAARKARPVAVVTSSESSPAAGFFFDFGRRSAVLAP